MQLQLHFSVRFSKLKIFSFHGADTEFKLQAPRKCENAYSD